MDIPVPGASTRVAEVDEEAFTALEMYTFADSLVDMGGDRTAIYPNGIEATGEEAPVRQ